MREVVARVAIDSITITTPITRRLKVYLIYYINRRDIMITITTPITRRLKDHYLEMYRVLFRRLQ